MTAQPAPSNHPVFLLAEHLDMILAAFEDLRACTPKLVEADPQRVGSAARLALHDFADDLRRFEMAAVVRVGRARILTRQW